MPDSNEAYQKNMAVVKWHIALIIFTFVVCACTFYLVYIEGKFNIHITMTGTTHEKCECNISKTTSTTELEQDMEPMRRTANQTTTILLWTPFLTAQTGT